MTFDEYRLLIFSFRQQDMTGLLHLPSELLSRVVDLVAVGETLETDREG